MATVPGTSEFLRAEALEQEAGAIAHAWREVNLAAVFRNVATLASACSPAELMVVVKADAYSHGAVEVARTALRAGATRLGVAVIDEALELRRAGVTAPVLAWLAGPNPDNTRAIFHDVELAAYSCAQLDEIALAADAAGREAVVHLKAETGMWRGGAAADQWHALVWLAARLEELGSIRVEGIWSHLAMSDQPGESANDEQLREFKRCVDVAERAGLRPRFLHLANSAAALTRPDMRFNLVRCGLAAYGLNPLADTRSPAVLEQAMSVKARLTHVKSAPGGVGVSYGHTYRTRGPSRLALVPLGYADGIPSVNGTECVAPAGWRGSSLTLAGRVCMDQLVLDVTGSPVRVGDEVTMLGPGTNGEYTISQWAAVSGRSVYEVLAGLARKRVRLNYIYR